MPCPEGVKIAFKFLAASRIWRLKRSKGAAFFVSRILGEKDLHAASWNPHWENKAGPFVKVHVSQAEEIMVFFFFKRPNGTDFSDTKRGWKALTFEAVTVGSKGPSKSHSLRGGNRLGLIPAKIVHGAKAKRRHRGRGPIVRS